MLVKSARYHDSPGGSLPGDLTLFLISSYSASMPFLRMAVLHLLADADDRPMQDVHILVWPLLALHRSRELRYLGLTFMHGSWWQLAACLASARLSVFTVTVVVVATRFHCLGARLRGHTATNRSKKGSGKGSQKGASCGFYSEKGF